MLKLHPTSTDTKPIAHILTVQGHPEFTPDIVKRIVDLRAESGVFDPASASEARRRAHGKDGSGGEGHGRVGWAIWRVMLQERPPALDADGDVQMSKAYDSKVAAYLEDETRYEAIDRVLDRRGPWTAEEFVGGLEVSPGVGIFADQPGEEGTEGERQDLGDWCWRFGMRVAAKSCIECVGRLILRV